MRPGAPLEVGVEVRRLIQPELGDGHDYMQQDDPSVPGRPCGELQGLLVAVVPVRELEEDDDPSGHRGPA
jgi:hypothetical protein